MMSYAFEQILQHEAFGSVVSTLLENLKNFLKMSILLKFELKDL